MILAEKIIKLRKQKGWTMYKLAEESMVTQSTLANMYARNTLPSITTLINICNGLGVSLSEFFCETNIDKNRINSEKFVVLYNKLTDNQQKAVLTLMQNLIDE
jgi:transcriptional regulator with XRE-family HTH domain